MIEKSATLGTENNTVWCILNMYFYFLNYTSRCTCDYPTVQVSTLTATMSPYSLPCLPSLLCLPSLST